MIAGAFYCLFCLVLCMRNVYMQYFFSSSFLSKWGSTVPLCMPVSRLSM
uniref:Uncharacterized protein n=1 Tax=Rhizophora mucronata TaxID=61149 RepID=A0A2P2NJT9_RHIMU